MDTKVLAKINRLLKRFPETWVHTRETDTVNGSTVTFHHVDYRSNVEGRPKVRLVSHVSSDMCELLVNLKVNAPALIAVARASATEAEAPGARKAPPRVSKVNNRRNPNA